MSARVVVSFALVLASASAGWAQAPARTAGADATRSLEAFALAGSPPVVDGRLDEEVWSLAPVATGFVQRVPRSGEIASQPTEVRIAYGYGAVYVAARMFDTHPDSIVAPLARRDADPVSDWFYVGLDSYHDRRTAFAFAVNPRGVLRDLLLYDDTRADLSWDAAWDGAARVDSLGWTAELRIPLSQLRFRTGAGEQLWGINFQRTIARRSEESFWAPTPEGQPRFVSLFGDLRGIDSLPAARRLEVRPYTVARLTRAPGADADPFRAPNDLGAAAGLDLKYGITSDLTVTATVNPDFGQVEADPSEVNLTAFETLLEEKRPFFTEGAEILRFNIGHGGPNRDQLFYSRRIGRAPQGSVPGGSVYSAVPPVTTILAAAKLSGKTASGWSIGVLDMVTSREEARFAGENGERALTAVEPRTNYGVARISRDFRRGQSAFGGMVTTVNRSLVDPELEFLRTSAYALGVDGRHTFGDGKYEATGWVAASRVEGTDSAIARTQRSSARYFQRPDADHLEYDPTRTSLSGAAAKVTVSKVAGLWRGGVNASVRSPGFEVNDAGFQGYAGQGFQSLSLRREQFRAGRRFRRWSSGVIQWSHWTTGGERIDGGLLLNGSGELHSFWGGSWMVIHGRPALDVAALRGGPAVVSPAYTYAQASLYTDRRDRIALTLSGSGRVEPATGSGRLELSPGVLFRTSGRLELVVEPSILRNRNTWQYVAARTADEERRYVVARIDQSQLAVTARLNYTFTPGLSLQLYAQPFMSAGRYGEHRELTDPRARRFEDRFRPFGAAEIRRCGDELGVRPERDGCDDAGFLYTVPVRDFNRKDLNTNAVLRWEYRPGSTLYAVWSHGRGHSGADGTLRLRRDLDHLLASAPTNVLLLKLSYWLDF